MNLRQKQIVAYSVGGVSIVFVFVGIAYPQNVGIANVSNLLAIVGCIGIVSLGIGWIIGKIIKNENDGYSDYDERNVQGGGGIEKESFYETDLSNYEGGDGGGD